MTEAEAEQGKIQGAWYAYLFARALEESQDLAEAVLAADYAFALSIQPEDHQGAALHVGATSPLAAPGVALPPDGLLEEEVSFIDVSLAVGPNVGDKAQIGKFWYIRRPDNKVVRTAAPGGAEKAPQKKAAQEASGGPRQAAAQKTTKQPGAAQQQPGGAKVDVYADSRGRRICATGGKRVACPRPGQGGENLPPPMERPTADAVKALIQQSQAEGLTPDKLANIATQLGHMTVKDLQLLRQGISAKWRANKAQLIESIKNKAGAPATQEQQQPEQQTQKQQPQPPEQQQPQAPPEQQQPQPPPEQPPPEQPQPEQPQQPPVEAKQPTAAKGPFKANTRKAKAWEGLQGILNEVRSGSLSRNENDIQDRLNEMFRQTKAGYQEREAVFKEFTKNSKDSPYDLSSAIARMPSGNVKEPKDWTERINQINEIGKPIVERRREVMEAEAKSSSLYGLWKKAEKTADAALAASAEKEWQDHSFGDLKKKKAAVMADRADMDLLRQDLKDAVETDGPEHLMSALRSMAPDQINATFSVAKPETYWYAQNVETPEEFTKEINFAYRRQEFFADSPKKGESNEDFALRHYPEIAPLRPKLFFSDIGNATSRDEVVSLARMPDNVISRLANSSLDGTYIQTDPVSKANNLGYLALMDLSAYGMPGRTYDQGAAGVYSPREKVAVSASSVGAAVVHELGHAMGDIFDYDNDPSLIESHRRMFDKLNTHTQTGGPGHRLGSKELLAFGTETYVNLGEKAARKIYDDKFVDWLKQTVLQV